MDGKPHTRLEVVQERLNSSGLALQNKSSMRNNNWEDVKGIELRTNGVLLAPAVAKHLIKKKLIELS